ncbi:hypothetical protein EON65_14250 [archaeon]|nr:MAG: hypothetical protein EON65_14250 [archaeon]
MSRVPNGVPTVTYCRLMPSTVSMSQGDIMADGNAVVVLEPGQPSSRFEVAQVLDKSHSDEEICDLTFGSRAGAGLGAVLNPVAAFVNDAANVVIMLTGSRMTKKWQFLKRCFLPFIANEILTSIAERSQQAPNNFYKAQLTLSTFEIHDEVIGDLLRPANRGLPIVNTLEDGVVVQGLHKETIVDEVTLRRLLAEACDNRATYGLPVGGNIDTSTGVFEFRLYQAEPQGQGQNVFQTQECYSKLTIIDVPSMDPLASTNPEEVRLLSGPTLHKSLLSLIEVCKKLNNPYRAQLAPFRSSKLTHFLSEMLGGNAIVVALAQVCSGEPQVSRRTLDFVSYLNSAVHYPMGAREFSDTIRGLLGKYRAMLMHLSDELHATANTSSSNTEHQTALITKLQGELAKSVTEMNGALEDRARIFEMSELLKAKYNTLMEEKLKQADDLAQSEEDNIALAKEVVEHELAHAQAMEQAEKEKLGLQGEIVTLEAQVDSLTADVTDYKEKCCKLEKQVVGDAKEVASKQTQIDDLFQQLQTKTSELNQQREKNIELGAELLTLVNHKDVLHKDLDELQTKNKNIDTVLAEHQSRHQEAELEIRKLLEKLVSKDEEIIELRKFKYMKQGKDNTASTASLEQPDPTNPAVVKAVESMRQAVDQKKERQFAKQIQSLERQLRRMEADFQGAKKERDQAVKEVIELRSKYRSLLQDTYNSAQQGQQPDSTVEKEYGGMDAQFNDADDPLEVLHIHHNLQSLLASYQNHETVLEDSYGQAVQTRQEAIEAYRQLYDHYRHSLDMVEDMMSIVQDGKYSGTTGSGTGRDSKDTSGGGKKMQLEARAKKILEESLAEQFQFGSTVV